MNKSASFKVDNVRIAYNKSDEAIQDHDHEHHEPVATAPSGSVVAGSSSSIRMRPRISQTSAEEYKKASCMQEWTTEQKQSLNNVQLHRKNFTERIRIEGRIRASCYQLALFLLMFSSYLFCILTYDPIGRMSRVHRSLKQKYRFDSLDSVSTPEDIMSWLQAFFESSYEMASALVDANTLDSIDFQRCFSDSVHDICRLKYWSAPLREGDPNYINRDAVVDDYLSDLNYPDSALRCQPDNPQPNCIDWTNSVNSSLQMRTFGLTPEDPIIMSNRLDYWMHSVVVLTPVVWQTRSMPVPCSGFGNTYNDQTLGAGSCLKDEPCLPDRVTSFHNSKRAPNGRQQRIYLTYDSHAFTCVDDSVGQDTFRDQSWSPSANFSDLHTGRLAKSFDDFEGSKIFYKFVSDTAYMQAPIAGEVMLSDADKCNMAVCDGEPARYESDCKDPLKYEDHWLWQLKLGDTSHGCDVRKLWNERYLESSSKRRNAWLTYETSKLSVATLLVTPQRENVVDIITIVRVDFTIDIDGFIKVDKKLTSTSETGIFWYVLVACQLFIDALVFFEAFEWRFRLRCIRGCCGRRCCWRRELPERVHHDELFVEELNKRNVSSAIDMVISLCTLVHIGGILLLDRMPPHETDDLRRAFKASSSEMYFHTFLQIMDYQKNLDLVKLVGFIVVTLQFLRLSLYMALHPRLAVLADTMIKSSDDLFHFAIYFFLSLFVLALLGNWAFGPTMLEHESILASLWTQFQMFTGTITFRNTPDQQKPIEIAYAVYMLVFIGVVFIQLLNFLLAIVVNGYTAVQEHVIQNVSESNAVADAFDVGRMKTIERWKGWPDTWSVWRYMADEGCGLADNADCLPAVTAAELHHNVHGADGRKAFRSIDTAQSFIDRYARKVWDGGCWSLMEARGENLLPPGHRFQPHEHKVGPKVSAKQSLKRSTTRRRKERRDAHNPLANQVEMMMHILEKYARTKELHEQRKSQIQQQQPPANVLNGQVASESEGAAAALPPSPSRDNGGDDANIRLSRRRNTG